MRRTRMEKGITLIALIITIVVLLILAAVAISSISNDGIIKKALTATQKWNESEVNTQQMLTGIEDVMLTDIEKLEKKYDLNYYADVATAMTVINDSNYDDTSKMVTKENANAVIYMDENNVPNIVLVANATIEEKLEPTVDVIINLAGKTLTTEDNLAINISSINCKIYGQKGGSSIASSNDNGNNTTLIKVTSGKCIIDGGSYLSNSNGAGTDSAPNGIIVVGATGTLTVADASIIAKDTDGGTIAGILVEEGGSAVISDSNIEVTSLDGLKSDGIRNIGTVTASNTSVVAYSNYTANAAKTDYATSTRGINNEGTMTLKNCEVYGTHSGIRSPGILYIDGGKYEGYGHGGIYFSCANATSYVKNAYIGMSEMRNGYDDGVAGTNKAGLYIGGASNVTVYMDNCELWGTWYPLVMRISSTEDNNSLYISNSTLKEGFEKYIRIGTSKNIKIYIGSGNNFNAEDHVYYDSNGEETNVDYSTQFPEY